MLEFCEGNADAFEQLVGRYQKPVFNFLLRFVADRGRAEELLQEVFLRVVRAKGRYRMSSSFKTWLYAIARNLCVDESRRARFRQHQSLDAPRPGADRAPVAELAAPDVPTDQAAYAQTLRTRIVEAVGKLPLEQREVFLLRQVSGLSFREIAQTVEIPENTVKSRMRYALEKLRGELGDLREPDGAHEGNS